MLQADETSVKHVVERGEQESVVAGDIEEAAGSPVLAEVRSSKDLEESFQRAGSAWERYEPFGELGRYGLALVHRADHA